MSELETVAGLVAAFREQADRAQAEWETAIKISPWEAEVAPEATWLRYAADFMERKLSPLDHVAAQLAESQQENERACEEAADTMRYLVPGDVGLDEWPEGCEDLPERLAKILAPVRPA